MQNTRAVPRSIARCRVVDRLVPDPRAERAELIAGLRADAASIAPKYFYDELGCALFQAICLLPEYYPTRTERAIFAAHRDAIARAAGRGRQFVDLGAGDCVKGGAWIGALAPRRYLAVDIARSAIEPAIARLADLHRAIDCVAVVADFAQGLDLDDELDDAPVTFFYPGSSIGNFSPGEARAFLASIRAHCRRDGSGLLIGVDTRKEARRLVAAYDDALGVTAAFNRNVLNHVNARLHCGFDAAAFAHRAYYDASEGRVSMHLQARTEQRISLDGIERRFAAGELIHTENAWKYAPEAFVTLLEQAGFARTLCWQDRAGDFAVYYAA